MPKPRFCRNPDCPNAVFHAPDWCSKNGSYFTLAHGEVQRWVCKSCGYGCSDQTESMHYYAKRRLDFRRVFSRLRGGSSLRDIGRELGYSRTAIANAVLRLGRQSMAAHIVSMLDIEFTGNLSFDGLLSALTSRDYASHITVLGDKRHELIVAMTQATTERGGNRTEQQLKRITAKRQRWHPDPRRLSESISIIVNELPRFSSDRPVTIDIDENPMYTKAIETDLAMRWLEEHGRLTVYRTPGGAPRTPLSPLAFVNHVDLMIRHRVKEHTRESIAIGRNAVMQMHRMWMFAWDYNTRQPARVRRTGDVSRLEHAGVDAKTIRGLRNTFYTRRISLRLLPILSSMKQVWTGDLESPPVRWKLGQKRTGPTITKYALSDLRFAFPQGV